MPTYGDIRKKLQEQPSTWQVLDDIPDDAPVPDFVVMTDGPKTGDVGGIDKEKFRQIFLEHPSGDPALVRRAADAGMIFEDEANKIISSWIGDAFSIKDFPSD